MIIGRRTRTFIHIQIIESINQSVFIKPTNVCVTSTNVCVTSGLAFLGRLFSMHEQLIILESGKRHCEKHGQIGALQIGHTQLSC